MGAILAEMTANAAIFKSPPIAFTVVSGHVVDLQAAETTAQTRTKGTAAARDAKKLIVIADGKQLHAYVQQLVNASPEDALTIANVAAMSLRVSPSKHKSDLAVKHVTSGTVKVVAKASKAARAHDWQYSADGGKTWTQVPPTLAARTTITGLTPGQTVVFRHRAITKTGASDWSEPVSLIVQ